MKKDLRIIKTKANLHEALVKLLYEKSLDKITVSELCKEAKINRGTFYLHYPDVNELFEEYFETITEDLKAAYYEPYVLTSNKIENLQSDMVRIFHHVYQYREFYKIVFDRKTPMMYYYRLFEYIVKYLSETLMEHEGNTKYIASYQSNAILGVILTWAEEDFKKSPAEINEIVFPLFKISIK